MPSRLTPPQVERCRGSFCRDEVEICAEGVEEWPWLGCLGFQTASDATEFTAQARLALQPFQSVTTAEVRWSMAQLVNAILVQIKKCGDHSCVCRSSFDRDEVGLGVEGVEESLVLLALAVPPSPPCVSCLVVFPFLQVGRCPL